MYNNRPTRVTPLISKLLINIPPIFFVSFSMFLFCGVKLRIREIEMNKSIDLNALYIRFLPCSRVKGADSIHCSAVTFFSLTHKTRISSYSILLVIQMRSKPVYG